MKTGHGPHLLRDFYRDFQRSWRDARALDNGPEDRDPRPDRVDLGSEQALLGPDSLAIRQRDARDEVLVWLQGQQQAGMLKMSQDGWARDPSGCYAFPLVLEGPPQTPFDPPEAQRVTDAQFEQACARYAAQWSGTLACVRERK